jgi:hypothetical protein
LASGCAALMMRVDEVEALGQNRVVEVLWVVHDPCAAPGRCPGITGRAMAERLGRVLQQNQRPSASTGRCGR